jgi:putative toxin-antitoxin system antitoxin component (TIGR02293 family)
LLIRHLLPKLGKFVAMPDQPKRRAKTRNTTGKSATGVITGKFTGQTMLESQREYAVRPLAHSTSFDNMAKTFSWLGMTGAAIKKLSSEFDYIEIGNSGITKKAINTLAENIGISRKYISENIFDVSVKTMERKDNRIKLDKKISSQAIEIAKVVQHAWQVFRDEAKVKHWMNQENRALNNKKPVELFDTLSGILMVHDILGRIEEGVYS